MSLLASDFTWFHLLPGYAELEHKLGAQMGFTYLDGEPITHVTHITLVLLATLVILVVGMAARASWTSADGGVVPAGRFTLGNFLETVLDAVLGLAEQVMGSREKAERFLPLIGTAALIILFSNGLSLIPGLSPPTDNFNITFSMGVIIFVATHIYGLKENGLHHLAHFLGPKIGGFPWLFPLMLPIELISHFARPVSLGLRLMGNMTGDHKVLAIFLGLTPFSVIFPVPLLIMGTLVCVVQTLVFCLLSMVYIGMAIEHSEEAH